MIMWYVFGIIFFLAGLVLLLKGVFRQIKCKNTTYGRVVNVKSSSSFDRDTLSSTTFYTPIIEYSINNQVFNKKCYGSTKKYSLNQDIIVHYNPIKYKDCYIDDEPKMLMIFGFVICLMGICILISGFIIF